MTRATRTKLEREGIVSPIQPKRNLTPEETLEIQQMVHFVNGRKFEADVAKGNTALIPDGQKFASQLEAMATLLENEKTFHISKKLKECGYPDGARCSLNLSTGEIFENL